MPLIAVKEPEETLLELKNPEAGLFRINHILEPEYHQDKYVIPCTRTRSLEGAFQVGDERYLATSIHRGTQPIYADDENDAETLFFEGMVSAGGESLERTAENSEQLNVCALKSNCVRSGFIDLSLARSVLPTFWRKNEAKAGAIKNDVLINSTGDGTIGRVAVYNYDFPTVVDGHITIVRYKKPEMAWYVAAYLLSDDGQKQMYRYVNGSSGQVEIYPQDIERVWIAPASVQKMIEVMTAFRQACLKHDEFYRDMKSALSKI